MSEMFSRWTLPFGIMLVTLVIGFSVVMMEIEKDRIRLNLDRLENKKMEELNRRLLSVENAISIHHSMGWSEKNRQARRVKNEFPDFGITDYSDPFESHADPFDNHFDSAACCLKEMRNYIETLSAWSRQGDEIIRELRLDPFRASVLFSSFSKNDSMAAYINKHHLNAHYFKIGDHVKIANPEAGDQLIDLFIKGYKNVPENKDIFMQIDRQLMARLGFSRRRQPCELMVQGGPEILRWKTFEQLYNEVADKAIGYRTDL